MAGGSLVVARVRVGYKDLIGQSTERNVKDEKGRANAKHEMMSPLTSNSATVDE